METYLGHPSRDHWNVHLWVNNEESWYRLLEFLSSSYPDPHDAAIALWHNLPKETPDGANITLAICRYVLDEYRESI